MRPWGRSRGGAGTRSGAGVVILSPCKSLVPTGSRCAPASAALKHPGSRADSGGLQALEDDSDRRLWTMAVYVHCSITLLAHVVMLDDVGP